MTRIWLLTLTVLTIVPAFAQQRVTPTCMTFGPGTLDADCITDWHNFYEREATICGSVAQILPMYASERPTYLLLNEELYVNGSFRIVIPHEDRRNFGDLRQYIGRGKFVCATGKVLKGRVDDRSSLEIPEMIITDPTRITLPGKPKPMDSGCKPWERWDGRYGRCIQWRAPY